MLVHIDLSCFQPSLEYTFLFSPVGHSQQRTVELANMLRIRESSSALKSTSMSSPTAPPMSYITEEEAERL